MSDQKVKIISIDANGNAVEVEEEPVQKVKAEAFFTSEEIERIIKTGKL